MNSVTRHFLVFVALMGALTTPAFAQATAYAQGQGGVNRIEVGIDVRASVRDRCGFAAEGAPNGSVDQAEIDRNGMNKEFAIRLNCTGPSRIAVSSLNGALVAGASSPGYVSSASYNVELRLVSDNGVSTSAKCDAASLKGAGSCAFAGTASTSNGLILGGASTKANGSYLRISAAPYAQSAPLVAGTYSDTLTITVSVAS